jgi:hypothetical protein
MIVKRMEGPCPCMSHKAVNADPVPIRITFGCMFMSGLRVKLVRVRARANET